MAALPPGVLGIALDSSACSGKVSGETCQLQCSQGYDLIGAVWWSDWMSYTRLPLRINHSGLYCCQYQYKLRYPVGLRYPLMAATGDASLTCQAETSTFTSSSAVCEPRCKTKVLEVVFSPRKWQPAIPRDDVMYQLVSIYLHLAFSGFV